MEYVNTASSESIVDGLPVKSLKERWLGNTNRFYLPFWLLVIFTAISWGWANRDQGLITAESGLGYWLGIIGASMMLLLLSYSLRKRLRALKRFLNIRTWFKLHMTLGVLGPLSILFHSNFHLGSLNSTVALTCMLLVAGSGFIGRYLYGKIHYGLYGEKIRLQQVAKDFRTLQVDMMEFAVTNEHKAVAEELFSEMDALVSQYSTGKGTVQKARPLRRKVKHIASELSLLFKQLEAYYSKNNNSNETRFEDVRIRLNGYSSILLVALRKLPGLQRSEQLFSLWHVVHIPIFGLMIITAITHVVAVHMY